MPGLPGRRVTIHGVPAPGLSVRSKVMSDVGRAAAVPALRLMVRQVATYGVPAAGLTVRQVAIHRIPAPCLTVRSKVMSDVGRADVPALRLTGHIPDRNRGGRPVPAVTDVVDLVAAAGRMALMVAGLGLQVFALLARATAGAVAVDIGIQLVRLPGVAGDVTPQGLGLLAALLGFPLQARRIHLGLLGIGTRTDGLRFPIASIELHGFSFPADFGSFLAVLLVALHLHGLPAPPAGEDQQHNQRHRDDGNHYPYPWSCIHVSHHFHFVVTGRPEPFRLTVLPERLEPK